MARYGSGCLQGEPQGRGRAGNPRSPRVPRTLTGLWSVLRNDFRVCPRVQDDALRRATLDDGRAGVMVAVGAGAGDTDGLGRVDHATADDLAGQAGEGAWRWR